MSDTATRKRRFTIDEFFVDHRPEAAGVSDLLEAKEIRLDRITVDPAQPRRSIDQDRLEELAASIRSQGVLQPIVVGYDANADVYVILHGERRWRASALAGLNSIPALVRDVRGNNRLLQQLMENIVREDLNAVDRAAALAELKANLGNATWEEVAAAVGIKRSRLFQLIGTARLPDEIRADITSGRLSEKQSRSLQNLPLTQQLALRDRIVSDRLTADQAARLARMLKASDLGDDRVAADQFLADRLTRVQGPDMSGDPGEQLSSAIIAATQGGRRNRAELLRIAKANGARPYKQERLMVESLALLKSLARIPETDLQSPAVQQRLQQIQRTLDSLLERSNKTS